MWHRYDGKITQHDEFNPTVVANVIVYMITSIVDVLALVNACKALGWLCEEESFKNRPCLKVGYRTPFTLAMKEQAQYCAARNSSYEKEFSYFQSMLKKQNVVITDIDSIWITCEFSEK
ncbi:hypothetical protein RDT67_10280 [Serratia fonticola]|uniref:Uncharacterized protein n=1 Tax=Serratia fonticola TaxID=47917 RepID=A0AAJ1YA64_SERFO|nr:hypothetical protein [Serratia fonticola]MDQ9126816.1 hypothetical protein [Serratia fonticola]